MTNYLHPKNLAPMVLDQALNIYRENVILSANTDDYVFSEVDKKILGKAINGYRYRKGFTDTLKGIVYRVVQSVKAIFGKSDWNKALNVLNKESHYYYTDSHKCDEELFSTETALKTALDNHVISDEEFDKHTKTYNKVKKTALNYLLKSLISLTKEKVKQPNEGDRLDLKGLIENIDLEKAPISKKLFKSQLELNKILTNDKVIVDMLEADLSDEEVN